MKFDTKDGSYNTFLVSFNLIFEIEWKNGPGPEFLEESNEIILNEIWHQ